MAGHGNVLAQTAAGVGGFLGEVMEGLKPDIINGLGFKLRDSLGEFDRFDVLRDPAKPSKLGDQPNEGNTRGTIKIDDLVAWGILGLAVWGMFTIAKG